MLIGWFKVLMPAFASCLMNMRIWLCFWLLIVFCDLNFILVSSFNLGVFFSWGNIYVLGMFFAIKIEVAAKNSLLELFSGCMSPAPCCWGWATPVAAKAIKVMRDDRNLMSWTSQIDASWGFVHHPWLCLSTIVKIDMYRHSEKAALSGPMSLQGWFEPHRKRRSKEFSCEWL